MAKSIDLKFALNLPPEKAIEYFRQKGYAITWDWRDLWRDAHARAFTVAKVTRMEILQDIRLIVDEAISKGISFEQFRSKLEPMLKAKGWWGLISQINPKTGREEKVLVGTPWRLSTIFRTNVQGAYMAGRYKELAESVKLRPFWQYVAVLDSRTRPLHRALHGRVFRADDPIWDKIFPPNGFNCRCHVRALSVRDIAKRGLSVEQGTPDLAAFPDKGFDFNPGKIIWQPDLSKFHQDIASAFRQIAPGLLREMPVENWKDLQAAMKRFAENFPGYFARGYGGIDAVPDRNFFMATFVRRGSISVSTAKFDNDFSPARDLLAAFKKISKGESLTFNEEHAIESLWHEIMHNTTKHPEWLGHDPVALNMMEVVNQFIARHTYDEFLDILGGKATHKAAIIEKGYGYGEMITNFRLLLERLDIAESALLPHLKEIHRELRWSQHWVETAKVLVRMSPHKPSEDVVRVLLENIDNNKMFHYRLKKLSSSTRNQ